MNSFALMMQAMMTSIAKNDNMSRMATHIHEKIDGVQSTMTALNNKVETPDRNVANMERRIDEMDKSKDDLEDVMGH